CAGADCGGGVEADQRGALNRLRDHLGARVAEDDGGESLAQILLVRRRRGAEQSRACQGRLLCVDGAGRQVLEPKIVMHVNVVDSWPFPMSRRIRVPYEASSGR